LEIPFVDLCRFDVEQLINEHVLGLLLLPPVSLPSQFLLDQSDEEFMELLFFGLGQQVVIECSVKLCDECAVVGNDVNSPLNWHHVFTVLLGQHFQHLRIVSFRTEVDEYLLACLFSGVKDVLHAGKFLLHQIDPAFQLVQLFIIFALLDQFLFFLQFVFPLTSAPDEVCKDNEGDCLELGEEIAEGLSSCSPREGRLHEVPGDHPVLLGEVEGHKAQDSWRPIDAICIITAFGVVALLEFAHIPQVIHLSQLKTQIRDDSFLMSQFLAKAIATDILIPLYFLDLNNFFIVLEHFCFIYPVCEVVAIVLVAFFASAKRHLH
jgi:hypothetical protein